MTEEEKDFPSELESLAKQIAKEAQKDETKLNAKVEAFKVLTPYFAALTKNSGKKSDDGEDDNAATFGNFRRTLRAVQGQGGSDG